MRDEPEGSDDVRWDPAAGTIDAAGLEGVDAVVHLAGAGIGDKKWTPARKQLILDSRTQGTDLLARTLAGLARPPRVLLSGSAVGYYGDQGAQTLVEESPAGRRLPRPGVRRLGGRHRTGGGRPGSGWSTSAPASSWPPTAGPSTACCCPSGSGSAGGSAPATST